MLRRQGLSLFLLGEHAWLRDVSGIPRREGEL
jgi:hypothetical protein